ncbi:TadE/TadG family type IV pilus assembly protein [Chelativorans xinjiangense]|uniref:TadE/TadG family type IV pilus assembly protein n=1 Tax=Chelativorans xinjiangense TaxID=2681485 RepID=UPI00135C9802|nr:TadE/TadG family type IV pilus assembly protein [Chelativorans xinjiangense]
MNIQAKMLAAASAVRRFLAEKGGVAAVEFAFIAPLMLAFYFLTMEFSQGIDTNKKVGRAAILAGDLVAQSPVMTGDELDAIMKIGEAVLQPYNRSKPEITITAIEITDEDTPRALVAWSRRFADGVSSRAEKPGSRIDVPKELMSRDSFLIRAEADLTYSPVITWSGTSETGKKALGLMAAFDNIPMGERYYLRPRVTREISCADC